MGHVCQHGSIFFFSMAYALVQSGGDTDKISKIGRERF